MTKKFTDATFNNEVLNSEQPVLVDFWAPWCGPCRAVGPTIDALAEEFDGSAKVGKVNIDDNPQAASGYGIKSIPAVLIFKDGEVVDTLVGVQPKEAYQRALHDAASQRCSSCCSSATLEQKTE